MKRVLAVLGAALVLAAGSAWAATITLFESELASDGSSQVVGGLDGSGLGSYTVKYTAPGNYFSGLYVDHEIDEVNNTFFNEYGAANGAPPDGLSWEIDEPGFQFGDIKDNFGSKTLDNANGVPISSPDDVAMALAWDFTLGLDETATIKYFLSTTAPGSGFYLSQTDPVSQATIYFYSTFSTDNGPIVPEPSSMLLLGAGLAGLAVFGRKRGRR